MILYNAIKTPDGTILESFSVHDFKTHVDAKTGKMYSVDGGTSYIRRSAHGDEIDLSQSYIPYDHAHNRKYLHWGTFGKNGDEELKYIRLCDITDEHLGAILEHPMWERIPQEQKDSCKVFSILTIEFFTRQMYRGLGI